jgi:hypothetical protein
MNLFLILSTLVDDDIFRSEKESKEKKASKKNKKSFFSLFAELFFLKINSLNVSMQKQKSWNEKVFLGNLSTENLLIFDLYIFDVAKPVPLEIHHNPSFIIAANKAAEVSENDCL